MYYIVLHINNFCLKILSLLQCKEESLFLFVRHALYSRLSRWINNKSGMFLCLYKSLLWFWITIYSKHGSLNHCSLYIFVLKIDCAKLWNTKESREYKSRHHFCTIKSDVSCERLELYLKILIELVIKFHEAWDLVHRWSFGTARKLCYTQVILSIGYLQYPWKITCLKQIIVHWLFSPFYARLESCPKRNTVSSDSMVTYLSKQLLLELIS